MSNIQTITLPNLGDFDEIEIIEILIYKGAKVAIDDSLIVLESDKATMEIPSPFTGNIKSVSVVVGDRISEGSNIATIEVSQDTPSTQDTKNEEPAITPAKPAPVVAAAAEKQKPVPAPASAPTASASASHASPAIRRFARELGIDIGRVAGSGPKSRVLKTDVQSFVKSALQSAGSLNSGGIAVSSAPTIDFSKFGAIETQALSRIKKISGAHLHRSWVTVPHVTQFDDADITDLEAFRKSLTKEAERKGIRLTPLVFIMKAVVAALQKFPHFNASLDASAENLVIKKYFNIGVAVDTPNGLMVPVIKDVDQKGIYALAAEVAAVAGRAREGKLMPADLQGGCFSISSLGGIGGTQFTPIVNAPEVAILGVARSKMTAVYQADGTFAARNILPLALSYDHRVIDGAQGARFTSYLSQIITDMRRVLL